MSLYPSLEDLKVDKVIRAQSQFANATSSTPAITQGVYQPQPATQGMPSSTLYPNLEELGDYMGLSLNSDEVQRNLALVPVADNVSFSVVIINIIAQMMPIRIISFVYILCSRPFQRTVTMHKDSSGHVGFIFKSGRITSLVKDGSAARNGLLTDHFICEINGQNVIGLKDTQIKDILTTSPTAMTITIMPKFIYEHMIKKMSSGLLKSSMDHSVPEV
ncbi:syntenin-1-like [Sinocyclocheilus rhinocerous]|uniref:syntenin-1-like n=1 Tax=Sinocyclocheilus rhinocerous TaxID=307959 RepID=UPI0007BA58E3|nr:PREDICTED: syntenin-1-like [Sinocyclocheilus rhinocerous]